MRRLSPYLLLATGFVLGVVSLAVLLFIRTDDDELPPFDDNDSPEGVLYRGQKALESHSGYRIQVGGQDFGLPGWGGVDGGVVAVNNSKGQVEATLDRTGDGTYTMIYTDGETFFRRTTCDHFARVPGGGRETMLPFLISVTRALENAEDPRFVETGIEGYLAVDAKMKYLGRVGIQIDLNTHLPLYISKPSKIEGAETTWAFSGWGEAPKVEKPAGEIPDQGPGGNPC